ncbi:MAG TPA: alanine racemase [Longimicrobiales bacterium]|nr:alanine racemase [Longimicrobiales bacterium]
MSATEPRTLADLETPCAVVDLDRMEGNLDRVAAYAAEHALALRPHTKTHKAPWLLAEQVARGAVGATVATAREAEAMASATDDILMAYPPVGAGRIRRLLELPAEVRLTVALDSAEALDALAEEAARAGRTVGVLVELDVGMHRCGVGEPAQALALARRAAQREGVEYRGILFYPGHIREHVDAQEEALASLNAGLGRHLDALGGAGLAPEVVSGGSTPALFASHRVPAQTEIRPGTYIFNDRTTAQVGACGWDEIAYTILATVVSTAVPGQAVIDAGSKALSREEIRGGDAPGLGALLDRPEVVVRTSSEEHGVLDLSGTDWRPRVGERVRVVPNHVCVSVNLQERIWGVRDGRVERVWEVEARGRARQGAGAA